ncbi:alpha/beta hydrolase [Bowmanella dokdonensis]|uniref:Alpha/beta hydrolase n=1 Tax=Bowmanella dokdonensis TaxID=751969 RepID=A0A939DQZ0_9ALTE|nr:alpha/beta hydrolase-fold protein [Bowmanella dokdonensis]MBN7826615.1 alpha/beta hydrolase [Bowmanella dokdonensis]
MLKPCIAILSVLLLSGCERAEAPRMPSATDNVQVLEQAIWIPGIEQSRTLRIYLPPGYDQTDKHYPVLYMHDGQNLFDDATSYAGEWGVDESLNELAVQGLELIVVGIDHGGEQRVNELTPWLPEEYGEAMGEAYAAFVHADLKPWVDSRYRTLTDRSNTVVMGSSMGGLMSHYLIYRYPQTFGAAGIFSPAYWIADGSLFDYSLARPLPENARLYLLMGGEEGEQMVGKFQAMSRTLGEKGAAGQMKVLLDPQGEHNEAFWRRHFKTAILWLFEQSQDGSPVAGH